MITKMYAVKKYEEAMDASKHPCTVEDIDIAELEVVEESQVAEFMESEKAYKRAKVVGGLLHYCAQKNFLSGLGYLWSKHRDIMNRVVNRKNNNGFTPLQLAAETGAADAVAFLLSCPTIDLIQVKEMSLSCHYSDEINRFLQDAVRSPIEVFALARTLTYIPDPDSTAGCIPTPR